MCQALIVNNGKQLNIYRNINYATIVPLNNKS